MISGEQQLLFKQNKDEDARATLNLSDVDHTCRPRFINERNIVKIIVEGLRCAVRGSGGDRLNG